MSRIAVEGEICGYCGGCVIVCHDDAITLQEVQLTIDEKCTLCNACVVFCPVGALTMVETMEERGKANGSTGVP
ncbi:MAG: 4Fe-4S binding protein [candidate division Zixibacteria bacterium]|nr:4Fe-4S binding protein [candidate division Zixibacteria bacterium]